MTQTQEKNVPALRFSEFGGEWEEKRLEEISSVRTGPFGSTLHEKDYDSEGTPIINVVTSRGACKTRKPALKA